MKTASLGTSSRSTRASKFGGGRVSSRASKKVARKSVGKPKQKVRNQKSMAFNALGSGKSTNALGQIDGEPEGYKTTSQMYVSYLLHFPAFEYAMGSIVLGNICVMVVEIDSASSLEESDIRKIHWTEQFGFVVLFIFAVELCLRLFALRRMFFLDPWNVFDFIIVLTDIVVSFLALLLGRVFPVTMLRIFRLAKLARVSKVLRVFPELRLLLASLLSALSAICWGSILLGLVLLAWSMAAVLFIHPLNKHIDYGDCERCPEAYSSVMNAGLTFWKQIVAGDSWGQVTIPVIKKHPYTILFFIPLFLTVGMTVVSLILGMVVSVAQQAKDDIKEVDNAQAIAAKFERQSNLLKHCKEMDIDQDGELSEEELLAGFEQPGEFRDSMEALGITREDFDVVWAILDTENTGAVCYKRLVSKLYSLKTSDSQFTLAYLKYHVTLIKDILTQIEENHALESKEEEKIEKELHKVEVQEELLLESQRMLLEKMQRADAPTQVIKFAENETQEAAEVPVSALDTQSSIKECHNPTNETQSVLQKIGDSIDGLRLEFKEMMQEEIHRLVKKEELCLEAQKQLLEKLQVANCHTPKEEEQHRASKGLAGAEQEIEATEGEKPQNQEPLYQTLNELRKHVSADPENSQGTTTARTVEETETHFLLKKVCCDVDRLRLEFKGMMTDLDRKFVSGAPSISAMERDIMRTEAELDLLVVPATARSSSCSLFPRCSK